MEPTLADLSRTIDPAVLGRRIRAARVAAKLTQTQLAATDASAAYISRIEDGQRRPSLDLLERMGVRLGVTLESLLLGVSVDHLRELQFAVDQAELSLVAGDHEAALRGADQLLSQLGDSEAPAIRRAALQVRAGGLEAAGQLNEAILVLESLTQEPAADAAWVRAVIALSRCLRDTGDYDRAVTVGERAAETIADLGLEGLTESIQLTVTLASALYGRGDTQEAQRTCMRALAMAEKYDSPVAKASAYWNASIIEHDAHGATQTAVDLAQRALALFELSHDNRNLAKLRAEVANLQLAQTPPDAAAALDTLEVAERELNWSGASQWELALVQLTRARAHLLLGDFDATLADVDQGLALSPDEAPLLHASGSKIRGQVAAADGRIEEAQQHFRRAVYALSAVGSDHDVAQLWFELGTLLLEVGDQVAAVDAFRSAGASSGLRAPAALPVTARTTAS